MDQLLNVLLAIGQTLSTTEALDCRTGLHG